MFFMEYNEEGRISNSSSEYSIKSGSQEITALQSVKSETNSFKLAIKYNFAQSTELFIHNLKSSSTLIKAKGVASCQPSQKWPI